jgi:hypothetical protein
LRIPKEKPQRHVASLDDYKQEEADSDSRDALLSSRGSPETIIGGQDSTIYTSRPNHSKFTSRAHATGSLQRRCYMKRYVFKTHLDTVHKTEEYLVPTFNIAGILLLKQMSRNMEYPLPGKSAIISMAINYCHKIYHFKDADGTDYTVLG